jgi:isoprenylcysteine carboxyl methyltransferase (ICMT) family protein YpbQ
LPTLQNHRLIVSRWWSKIRHPNLFGEIIMFEILLVPLFFKFSFPSLLGILIVVVSLITRSIVVNRRNAKTYESSWQRYIETVKYNLVPRIY